MLQIKRLIVVLVLSLGLGITLYAQAQTTPLPDLAVETVLLDPTFPQVGQPVTLTVQVRNTGTISVAGRRVYLYVDPIDQPPLTTTKVTKPFPVSLPWPAGDAMIVGYSNFTFDQPGRHVIYAWVDPLERITETNELNNLQKLEVDVLTGTNNVDTFEPDNNCAEAKEIATDGTVQTHNFNTATPHDEDWVKFQAQAGAVYTITAAGVEDAALPSFEVWSECAMPPTSFGTVAYMVYISPKNAPVYVRLTNDSASYSADKMGYRLTVVGAGESQIGLTPQITAVNPKTTTNNKPTEIVMTGQNLALLSQIQLCLAENNQCNSNCVGIGWKPASLSAGNEDGDKQVNAVIQPNLRPGDYCAAVTNLSNYQATTLVHAVTINAADLSVMQISPTKGFINEPTELHLYGERLFKTGLTVMIGATSLTNLTELTTDGTHLKATVPTNLAAGEYPVKILYGTGESLTLPTMFRVLPSPNIYLPLVLKSPPPPELPTPTPTPIPTVTPTPIPMTSLYINSVNTGGITQVEIRDPNNHDELLLTCGPIGNNVVELCGRFKVINFYKIIAVTNRCRVLQTSRVTENPGGNETRRVICD